MTDLAFDVVGTGPGIVLVHGTNSNPHQTWGGMIDELAKDHTVVLPSLPGSVATPLVGDRIDGDEVADLVVSAGRRAGLERFAVAGSSLGSPISLKAAARHHDVVTHVISVAGFAAARPSLDARLDLWEQLLDAPSQTKGALLLILGATDSRFAAMSGEQRAAAAAFLGGRDVPGIRQQITLARTIDARGDLARITQPLLLIAGTDDNFVDLAHTHEIAAALPAARLATYPAGHGVASEFVDDVAREIRGLLG